MSGLPQGEEKVRAVRNMFDTIAPKYERLNRMVSLGLDTRWRRASLALAKFPPGSTIADVATGTGDYLRLLTAEGHFIVGVDLSYGMLAAARTDSPLVQADGLQLPFADASLDGITCGFALRNVRDLQALFKEFARVLKPSGTAALLDAAQPTIPIVRFGHNIWFNRMVPKIGALFSNREAYTYLPKSLSYLPQPEVMDDMLSEAGFDPVTRETVLFGVAQIIAAQKTDCGSGQE